MKRFVVPPDWPTPPRRSWVPPKTWRPDPSWPPAPADWQFWVDGKGAPVRGPIGRYAGPSGRTVFAGAGALVLTFGVVIWALSAVGLFGGGSLDGGAARTAVETSTTPTRTPVVPPKLPTVAPSSRTPTATEKPMRPDVVRSRKPRLEPVKPTTPPKTTKPTKTPTPTKPTTTTSRPPTRDEILRQYCIDRGWPPEWCVPHNTPTNR
ncbi:hypothetical protein ACI2LF_08895 [Kribbella sp. NPDC020789]